MELMREAYSLLLGRRLFQPRARKEMTNVANDLQGDAFEHSIAFEGWCLRCGSHQQTAPMSVLPPFCYAISLRRVILCNATLL